MSSNNNTVIISEETLESSVKALKDTSKMIRYLVAHFNSLNSDHPIADTEKYLKKIGITTKKGDPIRYQHVRNVAITPLSTK